jgi:enamine deaminase RidA (YjgF/YER057c/UK114 family)
MLIAGAPIAFSQSKRNVAPSGMVVAGVPSSAGVSTGDLLHISGMMGTDNNGQVVMGGIEAQTRRALERIDAVLKSDRMTLKDVVSVSVYLADTRDFDAMNKVYGEVFPDHPPVRATIQADLVVRDALVEISAIAARPDLPRRYILPEGWAANLMPYSKALVVGDYIFLAGVVAQNPRTGAVVEGDVKVQTRQVLDNAKALVETAGFHLSDLVWSRIWLADRRDYKDMNEVYGKYWGEIPPTRAATRAGLTSTQYKVEIMLWGMKGNKQVPVNPSGLGSLGTGMIKVGSYVFLSGVTVAALDTRLTASETQLRGDVAAQTIRVLTRLQSRLRSAGVEFDNVVEAQIWITDTRDFATVSELYKAAMNGSMPPTVMVGSELSSPDNLVEIAMIAYKPTP